MFLVRAGRALTQVGSAGGKLPSAGAAAHASGAMDARSACARALSIFLASIRIVEWR